MTAVQPGSLFGGDEKLRSVGVFSGVGHRQPAGAVMLQLEVFVGEPLAVDATASGTVALGEISALDHEVPDDPVEFAALVSFAFRFLGELDKVLGGFRYGGAEHSDLDTLRCVRAHFDVEPDLRNGNGSVQRLRCARAAEQ